MNALERTRNQYKRGVLVCDTIPFVRIREAESYCKKQGYDPNRVISVSDNKEEINKFFYSYRVYLESMLEEMRTAYKSIHDEIDIYRSKIDNINSMMKAGKKTGECMRREYYEDCVAELIGKVSGMRLGMSFVSKEIEKLMT